MECGANFVFSVHAAILKAVPTWSAVYRDFRGHRHSVHGFGYWEVPSKNLDCGMSVNAANDFPICQCYSNVVVGEVSKVL
jgi:hypothetical protein